MPKPVRQLQENLRPLEERIMDLLRAQPDSGFTCQEVAARVVNRENAAAVSMTEVMLAVMDQAQLEKYLRPWNEALNRLCDEEKAQRFVDQGVAYYALAGGTR